MIYHVIRHAKTKANEQKLYCGFTDVPLSEKGISELLELKKGIKYPKGDFYITSGMLRTNQTANILYDNPQLVEINEFKEINFGDFEYKSYEQLKKQSNYINWITNIDFLSPPNGETKQEFVKRIKQGLIMLESICKPTDNVVIITHGGVIAIIMELLFPNKKDFYQWQPSFVRGYTIYFDNKIRYENI